MVSYKREKIPKASIRSSDSSSHSHPPKLQALRSNPSPVLSKPLSPSSDMAGSGFKGKWEVSCVTDVHIQELKRAGYLSANIVHRAPEAGQVVPTPKPDKRVVFIPPLHPGTGLPATPLCQGLNVLLRFRLP